MERTDERALRAFPQKGVDLTRPTLAWDIRRVVAGAVSAASAVSDPIHVSSRDLCAAASEALRDRTDGAAPASTARDIVIAEMARRLGVASQAASPTADQQLQARVRSGDMARQMIEAWDATSDPGGKFEPVIAAAAESLIDGEELANALIGYESQRHVNLVWLVANRLVSHFPDRASSDLFGWGYLGLRVALRNYDPTLGFKFSTYACQRISGQIRDGVRQENPIPKRLTTLVRKVARIEEDLSFELGRAPQIEEVAMRMVSDEHELPAEVVIEASLGTRAELAEVSERIDAKLSELQILPRLAHTASVEELTATERGAEIAPLTDDTDPADAALGGMQRDAIEDAFAQLDEEDAQAARLLLYEGRTVAEARAITGATAQQLRRRCDRAKRDLAALLAEWDEVAV